MARHILDTKSLWEVIAGWTLMYTAIGIAGAMMVWAVAWAVFDHPRFPDKIFIRSIAASGIACGVAGLLMGILGKLRGTSRDRGRRRPQSDQDCNPRDEVGG